MYIAESERPVDKDFTQNPWIISCGGVGVAIVRWTALRLMCLLPNAACLR